MFIHRSCGGTALLTVPNLTVLGFPSIDYRTGLSISHISLKCKQQRVVDVRTRFYCTSCKKEIDVNEILIECTHCYDFFEPEDLTVFRDYGGYYCPKEAKKLKKELDSAVKEKKLSELIKTMTLKGER